MDGISNRSDFFENSDPVSAWNESLRSDIGGVNFGVGFFGDWKYPVR